MTWLAPIILAALWWLVLRTPSASLPPYVLRGATDTTPSDLQAHIAASMDAWDERHRAAGYRRDQLALRAIRAAGEAQRARWLAHQAQRARHARIPPTQWPRVAAAMDAAVEAAQPLLNRRVTTIRLRRQA